MIKERILRLGRKTSNCALALPLLFCLEPLWLAQGPDLGRTAERLAALAALATFAAFAAFLPLVDPFL